MVSVIIPHYNLSNDLLDLLSNCVASLVGYDELILQFHTGDSFSKAVNKGVARSKGDYIAIVSNDILMLEGSLKDYCKPNTIVRPTLTGQYAKFPFVVMPRNVWDLVGGLDEDFKVGFYEDKLFLDIARSKGVILEYSPLKIWHKGSATIGQLNPKELMKINKEIYQDKHKKYGL